MEKAFKNLVKSKFPFLLDSKLLLAVSGGVDSVVLAHLLKKCNLDFSMAHCNFKLRGEESDADEKFVAKLAEDLDVAIFAERFSTEEYAEKRKISVQMAARELRYQWFGDLKNTYHFDYILTAHHANDNLETFLINLVRGTGPEGLLGIKEIRNDIIRPLLPFSRKKIEAYASENDISWREDSSNASDKYMRNKIRHKIVPVLEELNENFLDSFANTQKYLQDELDLVEDYLSLLYPKIVTKNDFGYELDIAFLKKIPNTRQVLFQLLKSFGFTNWEDVVELLDAQPGKVVFSGSHRLIKDREKLLLTKIPSEQKANTVFSIDENEDFVMLPIGTFSISTSRAIESFDRHCIYVPIRKLSFPLKIRKWQAGDHFIPFGMKGTKKISDFMKDEKFSLPEKESTWVLLSDDKIVWVINHRLDDRFKVEKSDNKLLKISFSR